MHFPELRVTIFIPKRAEIVVLTERFSESFCCTSLTLLFGNIDIPCANMVSGF